MHLIFHQRKTRRYQNGVNIQWPDLDAALMSFHRKGTLPLVYAEGAIENGVVQGGLAKPGTEFNQQEKITRCPEPAYVHGAAISAVSMDIPKVTAHELGHAIGCLPDRNANNGGKEFMLMWNNATTYIDVYGPGVTLEQWEVDMMRKWGRFIP